jgi:hypothetical protein
MIDFTQLTDEEFKKHLHSESETEQECIEKVKEWERRGKIRIRREQDEYLARQKITA